MWKRFFILLLWPLLEPTDVALADTEVTREQIQFFESKVRPLLASHCYQCHGPEKQKGKLRLDSRSTLVAGGESGPAIVENDPAASLLIQAINYQSLEMPPSGKLKDGEIEILTRWVAMGAPWTPGEMVRSKVEQNDKDNISEEDRQFWSFQPIVRPPVPTVEDSRLLANPVDAFILAAQEAAGLRPSPAASKREMIRRAYFDLIGLPPTPEQVDTFATDNSPDAFVRLIDRLLASPHYGERWGRHWLDLVRYGESNGYERDHEKPHVWRFRDYVIEAFNEDKPYDQFVREQLAGDELDEVTHESIIATGFYRIGPWDDEPDDKILARHDELDDAVSTIGSSFLGLTIGCARCHEHKFDPIPQEDYYRLVAFVQGVAQYGKDTFPTHWVPNEDAVYTPLFKSEQQAQEWLTTKNRLRGEIEKIEEKKKDTENDKPLDEEIGRLKSQLDNPPFDLALSVRGNGPQVEKTFVLIRGNPLSPAAEVSPVFLSVLSRTEASDPVPIRTPQMNRFRQLLTEHGVKPTSGRRRQLAEWIVDRQNPLTPRVIANRIWHYHFGRGIVPTPSDFGSTGMPPSHPQLLDWMASMLTRGNWQLKRMHRLIMLSNTYGQSSRIVDERAVRIDPDNRLVWRQNLKRLEAEALRDTILAVSGRLNMAMEGPSVVPALPAEVLATQSMPGNGWNVSAADAQVRRSVYVFIKRTLGVPLLETFDMPSSDKPEPARNTTTIASQALILLNSEFIRDQSISLAQRLIHEAGSDQVAQIEQAFRLAFGRSADDNEILMATAYLDRQRAQWRQLAETGAEPEFADGQALMSFCQLVLNMNEFAYID
ncbi:MAG: PSD1 and planctomycete cytochrome C domain-containing protein [Pirellulaceae bacterium]|nr:PSD1 and planctomycete cytochrome C domain-containing protein [Pirellulaceae bacterium]